MSATDGHVLVVEDDETIRESLVELLHEYGYAAESAADGREALDKLAAPHGTPCLILLDLMMPGMDGREFRERQLGDPALSEIPVVVISAYRDLGSLADELRPVAMLEKPLRLADLLGVVKQHCCTRTAGQEV
jgi:CheY-like chemotaxis protein